MCVHGPQAPLQPQLPPARVPAAWKGVLLAGGGGKQSSQLPASDRHRTWPWLPSSPSITASGLFSQVLTLFPWHSWQPRPLLALPQPLRHCDLRPCCFLDLHFPSPKPTPSCISTPPLPSHPGDPCRCMRLIKGAFLYSHLPACCLQSSSSCGQPCSQSWGRPCLPGRLWPPGH